MATAVSGSAMRATSFQFGDRVKTERPIGTVAPTEEGAGHAAFCGCSSPKIFLVPRHP
jgi:hypothetical protein